MEEANRDIWWPQWVWVGECFFWYWLTLVVLDKIHRAVKWLCVCTVKFHRVNVNVLRKLMFLCSTLACHRNGVYPLTAFSTAVRAPVANRSTRANTPELVENTNNTEVPEPVEVESRLVIRHSCQIHQLENSQTLQVHLLFVYVPVVLYCSCALVHSSCLQCSQPVAIAVWVYGAGGMTGRGAHNECHSCKLGG